MPASRISKGILTAADFPGANFTGAAVDFFSLCVPKRIDNSGFNWTALLPRLVTFTAKEGFAGSDTKGWTEIAGSSPSTVIAAVFPSACSGAPSMFAEYSYPLTWKKTGLELSVVSLQSLTQIAEAGSMSAGIFIFPKSPFFNVATRR